MARKYLTTFLALLALLSALSQAESAYQLSWEDTKRNNQAEVDYCANRMSFGTIVRVDYFHTVPCKKGSFFSRPVVSGGQRRYTLRREADGIHMLLKVRLHPVPANVSGDQERAMLAEAQGCIPKINELWGRAGLFFDLTMDSVGFTAEGTPDQDVDLVDPPLEPMINGVAGA